VDIRREEGTSESKIHLEKDNIDGGRAKNHRAEVKLVARDKMAWRDNAMALSTLRYRENKA